jgi:hypothetical protein
MIMDSRFDDWFYWHFFTITLNSDGLESMTVYDSLHSLLDHQRLLFHCDEWRKTNSRSHLELPCRTFVSRVNLEDSKSEPYVTTDGQSVSLSWNKAPIWGLRPEFYYCQTVAGLLMCGVLSDKRTGLSFTSCCPSWRVSTAPYIGKFISMDIPLYRKCAYWNVRY